MEQDVRLQNIRMARRGRKLIPWALIAGWLMALVGFGYMLFALQAELSQLGVRGWDGVLAVAGAYDRGEDVLTRIEVRALIAVQHLIYGFGGLVLVSVWLVSLLPLLRTIEDGLEGPEPEVANRSSPPTS